MEIRSTFTAQQRVMCSQNCKAKLYDIEQGKAALLPNVLQGDKMTVEEWSKTCLETYSTVGVRDSTYGSYESIIKNHLDFGLRKMKMSEATNANIQEHLQRKERVQAIPTVW